MGLFDDGLEKIYTEQLEYQTLALTVIAEDIRKCKPDMFLKYKCFFVPNKDYMTWAFGKGILDSNLGFYREIGGELVCNYVGRMCIPFFNFEEKVAGFIGYSDGSADKDNPKFIKYLYPHKNYFNKSNFVFMRKDEYLKARRKKLCICVDGVIDKIHLSQIGADNSMSLLGTAISQEQSFYLRDIGRAVVAPDNDSAGTYLTKQIIKLLGNNNVWVLKQGEFKDIDDFLKKEGNVEIFNKVVADIERGIVPAGSVYLRG